MRRVAKNVFCVNQQQSGVLIGFIRKISTHFICVCTYNKQALSNYYQQTLSMKCFSLNGFFLLLMAVYGFYSFQ